MLLGLFRTAAIALLATGFVQLGVAPVWAESGMCIDCIKVRVGPAIVVRGPFPDELDAPFAATQLPDGSIRGFSANGATYAIDGITPWDMGGARRPVLEAGPAGSVNECGRWLTSLVRTDERLLGLVHQESICDYGPGGQTDKSMAIAVSSDDGLSWTDLGTVITGPDSPQPGTTSGEGDCTMLDGRDGYLYAYCLRASDWQTIVARAPVTAPTQWLKYREGAFSEPGLDGAATDIGFVGTATAYLPELGLVAAVATDPWFEGLRLSLSADKLAFVDLDEPLIAIDGSNWERPAPTDLVAYSSLLDPIDGSSTIGRRFVLSYIYIPPGEGFESRYLVNRDVELTVEAAPEPIQVGMALTRWTDPATGAHVTSTGPLTGDRLAYRRDAVVAYMLTRAPQDVSSIRIAECSRDRDGRVDHLLADDAQCETAGYRRERTAGWLFTTEQPGTVPVYRCVAGQGSSHFASNAEACEGLGEMQSLLGYGLAP
jgi:hypothetical protein